MTQTPILLKKLHELEAELGDVYRLQLETTPPGLHNQISFDDVVHRIEFLNNLCATEVNSQPENTDELREIAQRLIVLEKNFHQWNANRTSTLYDHNDIDETRSICSSCTQKLQLDEDYESDSPVSLPENFYGEESPEKRGNIVKEKDVERTWRKIGKYCGVFGSGVILGAVCVIKFLYLSDFAPNEFSVHLPPT